MASVAASHGSSRSARPVAMPALPWAGIGIGAAVTLVLCAVAFAAAGGIRVQSTAPVEIGLTLTGCLLCGAAALRGSGPVRLYGATAFAGLAALTILTALSIVWSVEPSDTWIEVNRTLSYLATFAGGVALVRLATGHWAALLGGVLGACAVICTYAVLTKVLPGALDPDAVIPRLRAPFDYWNAIGLVSALTLPPALWLGARRSGHQAVNALAYPLVTLALVTMLLAYSRGSIAAAIIGCGLWFAVVPLRLRAVVVLVSGIAGALLVVVWALGQDALTEERLPDALRNETGTELGVLLLLVGLALVGVGLACSFAMDRSRLAGRRRGFLGAIVLVVVSLGVVGGGVALATSDSGIDGTVEQLFDPNAPVPDNSAGRLTSSGSVRARYYRDAVSVFEDNLLVGAGAGAYETVRSRYRQDRATVRHAHGYVAQTLADLGLVGILLSLAAAVALLWAAARTCGASLGRLAFWRSAPANAPPPGSAAHSASGLVGTGGTRVIRLSAQRWPAERVGMVTLAALALTFGAHSLVDWTWFIPGCAVITLVCAGWLVGRGPLDGPVNPPNRGRRGMRWAIAAGIMVVALIVAYAIWQPWRSVSADDAAIVALEEGRPRGALSEAQRARSANPLAVEPLFTEAKVQEQLNQPVLARRALERAVQQQPNNPETWRRLAAYVLLVERNQKKAIPLARAALYLNPRSLPAQGLYLLALRGGYEKGPATSIPPSASRLPPGVQR